MKHHVFIATTPKRADSFAQVMMCLESQIKKPDHVWIWWDDASPYPDLGRLGVKFRYLIRGSAYLDGKIITDPGRGVFERWEFLSRLQDFDLVTIMDDDWFFDPWYLSNCQEQWEKFAAAKMSAPVIGWLGWLSDKHRVDPSWRAPCPIPLGYIAGGMITGTARSLRAGWKRAPEELMGRRWGDDLALSVGLQRAGIRRIRPAGWSHAIELPSHRGEEALQMQHGDKMLAGVKELFSKWGVNAI